MRNFIEEYVISGYQLKHILYGINYYILRHVLVSESYRLNNGLKLDDAAENMCVQIGTECVLLGTSCYEYNEKERIYDPNDRQLFELTSDQCWTTAGYEFIELLGKNVCSKRNIKVESDETNGVTYFIPDETNGVTYFIPDETNGVTYFIPDEEITNATEAIDDGLTKCLTIGMSDLRIGMISATKEYNFICEMINRYKTSEKK